MKIVEIDGGFSLTLAGREILRHTDSSPCFQLGNGVPDVESHSGVFKVREKHLIKAMMPTASLIKTTDKHVEFIFENMMKVIIEEDASGALIKVTSELLDSRYNRYWISLLAEDDEGVYGGGELFDRQNLRGSDEPLWISEPGVGRRLDLFTLSVAAKTHHWPKWYNSNFVQPAWITSSGLYFFAETSAFGHLDFTKQDKHTFNSWQVPKTIYIGVTDSMKSALSGLSDLLGRQPKLPEWTYDGMWVGMQGGKAVAQEKIKKALDHDFKLGAIWCQDWEGIRMTSFGKQLRWCWDYDRDLYPDLPEFIKEIKKQGVRYLAYTNTFLTPGSDMYDEADRKGYLVKREDGENYPVYVPFDPGMLVDFTNPEACQWLKEVLKKNLIEQGISGWMADFGEYIPTDGVLHSGESPLTYHNRYPEDWARINHEAVKEAGMEDEVIFFMRSTSSGAIKYMSSFWTGDQLVDWSREDGFPSAINASLMMGVAGVGYVHSDIGGYTTLGYKKRTKELLIRWAEYAAFTQIMRSHEGNRPQSNVQFDSDDQILDIVGKMTRVYAALKPYHIALNEEYQKTGIPPMRMTQMHYPKERKALEQWPYQYLYGEDLLVAPVITKHRKTWAIRLPSDDWVHLWNGKEYEGGTTVTVPAPWGEPPVFYKKGSTFKKVFEGLRRC